MLLLEPHHIIDLYCEVDGRIVKEPPRARGGRPAMLSTSEMATILIWNTLVVKQKTLRDLHQWLVLYHAKDFKTLPKYKAFVAHCHRLIPALCELLESTFETNAPLRFMDSTMIPVCKYVRAEHHRVAKNIAQFGKNHQGWHYGFKLHASVNNEGKICQMAFTPANIHDAQMMPSVLNTHARIAVGDSSYGARVMGRMIWERYGTAIIAPPHYKQKKKIMTWWQHLLLTMRPKIESVFDYLKEHLHLVSSFPRSVSGYLLHYVRILLGYQAMRGF